MKQITPKQKNKIEKYPDPKSESDSDIEYTTDEDSENEKSKTKIAYIDSSTDSELSESELSESENEKPDLGKPLNKNLKKSIDEINESSSLDSESNTSDSEDSYVNNNAKNNLKNKKKYKIIRNQFDFKKIKQNLLKLIHIRLIILVRNVLKKTKLFRN